METLRLDWSPVLEYTEQKVVMYAPREGGVYCLSYQSDDERTIFYVSQAPNLAERLLAHLSDTELNACIKSHIRDNKCTFRYAKIGNRFAEAATIVNRNGAERALYDKYRPTCNDVTPPGPPADVNF